jgi:hypothetical protein
VVISWKLRASFSSSELNISALYMEMEDVKNSFKISIYIYCLALSDRRRVLNWQLDLLQSYLTINYNWVSLDSLSLTTHDWIYHNNSAAIVTAATLVTGELLVPFLPFLGYQLTQPPTQNSPTTPSPKTTPTLQQHWGIWPLDGL